MSKNISGATIGIDLGTTNSCIGYYTDNGVEIIPNDQGNRTTPSYVTYTDDERLIGDASIAMSIENIKSTVYGAKRFIGRKYDDLDVQEDIKTVSYEIVDKGNQPTIKVKYLKKVRMILGLIYG